MFPFMNAGPRFLGRDYITLEVSWARSFGHVAFTTIAFLPTSGLRMFITRQPRLQFARSAIQCLSNGLFVAAAIG